VASTREKMIQDMRSESDIAFIKMTEEIRKENGRPVYFPLENDGVYSIRKE